MALRQGRADSGAMAMRGLKCKRIITQNKSREKNVEKKENRSTPTFW